MIQYPVRVGQFAEAVFAFIKDSSDRMICGGLSREDAEEIVNVLNAQPRKKSKKVQIEEQLKRSDLTAQLSGR